MLGCCHEEEKKKQIPEQNIWNYPPHSETSVTPIQLVLALAEIKAP